MKITTIAVWMTLCLWITGLIAFATEPLPTGVSSKDTLPGFAELLMKHQYLFKGGHHESREEDGSWLVLGTGTAPLFLEGGRGQSEENAWIVANVKALAEMAEARMSSDQRLHLPDNQTATDSNYLMRVQRMSETERNAIIARSWEVGRWKLSDSNEVGVLRVVASPGYLIDGKPIEQLVGRIPVLSDTLDPVWREKVLAQPILRYGGVSIAQHEGRTWFLVAGVTQIRKGIVAVPPDAITVAKVNAKAVEWSRFIQGVHIQDRTRFEREMMLRIQSHNETAWEIVWDMFSNTTEAEMGILRRDTRGMIPVGMWLSDAGDTYRLVAVYRRTLDGSIPDRGYAMDRPAIPK